MSAFARNKNSPTAVNVFMFLFLIAILVLIILIFLQVRSMVMDNEDVEPEMEMEMEETTVETPQIPQIPTSNPTPTTVSRQNPNQTMAPETIYLTKPMDPLQMVPFK